MRTMLYFIAAGLMWGGLAYAQPQYPTAEVPTSEPAYLAKVKTAAPERIMNKATIIIPTVYSSHYSANILSYQ